MISSLGTRATNLEYGDVVLDYNVGKLNEDLSDAVVEFDAQVTNLNVDLADLGGKLNTTTNDLDDLNGAVVEVEGKVAELNGAVINVDGTVIGLKEKLDGTVVNVTGLDEDITDLSSHLDDQDDKIAELNSAVINVDGTVTDLKEKLDGTVVNVTDLKEDITDLSSHLEDQDDKVAELNSTVINVDGTVTDLKEKLDGTVVEVTGLNEDITDLSSHLEDQDGKIEKLKLLIKDLMEFSGQFDNIFGGYEYAFIETKQPWAAHEAAAISWGGHLASIHSDAEGEFIAKRIKDFDIVYPFIGGQRISNIPTDGSDKAWKWSDGTRFDYSAWKPDEPNIATENVIHLGHSTMLEWNDIVSTEFYTGVYKRAYP